MPTAICETCRVPVGATHHDDCKHSGRVVLDQSISVNPTLRPHGGGAMSPDMAYVAKRQAEMRAPDRARRYMPRAKTATEVNRIKRDWESGAFSGRPLNEVLGWTVDEFEHWSTTGEIPTS